MGIVPSSILKPNFQPGGIHNCLDFWDGELQAGDWVKNLIKFGYTVPFATEPLESELPNNATVRANPQVVEDQVKLLIHQGVLRRINFKPHCVNPLGLVTKTVQGVVKHRLIFDGSRLIKFILIDRTLLPSLMKKVVKEISCWHEAAKE